MSNYSDTLYNGIVLKITSITPTKKQKTRKSVIGKTLVQTPIIGMGAQEWNLKISGNVTGTTQANLATNRANIEAFEDLTPHAYTDGVHDGTFYLVPGSLSFEDSGDLGNMSYRYSMVLVEE